MAFSIVSPSSIYADTYKYRDNKGQFHFVISVSDIPERYRDRAVKVEVSKGKSSVNIGREDETQTRRVSAAQNPADRKKTKKNVEIYVTTWCPICTKLEKFLKKEKIKYKKYDIEKSSEGRKKYRKLGGRGSVPLIKVGSEVFLGYNPQAILSAYNQ